MPMPAYESKVGPETAWAAIITPLGGFVGLLVNRMTDDGELAVAAAALVTGLARFALGYFLPSPPLPDPSPEP